MNIFLLAAKLFWLEATIIKLGREQFRWDEDLGFSSSQLSSKFLHYKQELDYQVSLCYMFEGNRIWNFL